MTRILVVDDEPQIRTLLRIILEKEGYQVVEARDGEEALNVFHREPADLIITDLIMPGKEGIETIREFRKRFPKVKIIAMSGGGRAEPQGYLHLAQRLGAAKTLAKPMSRNEILEAVAEVLTAKDQQ